MSAKHTCKFKSIEGEQCSGSDLGNGYCFWHDTTIDKSGMELTERLEAYASGGGMLQGICLKRTKLNHVNLVRRGSAKGYDMRGADLYRAELDHAHLFNINLENASLMKADLSHANLHCAQLHNTNLLGTILQGARIDNIKLGQHVQQEAVAVQADKDKDRAKAIDFYEQSEEIYRNLRKAAESDGIYALVGYCARKELTMRRKQYNKFAKGRIVSKAVDMFCGYGESPFNVIAFSLMFIFFCAILYFLLGINTEEGALQLSFQLSFWENLRNFFTSIYFSVVTFTTLGYGDIQPIGFSRLIATIEAFIGSFALALYVVVFVQKATR